MIDMVVSPDKELLCILGFLSLFFKMKKNSLSLSFLKSCHFIWVAKCGTISSSWHCGKEVGLVSVQLHPSLVIPFVLSLYDLRISKHMYFQLLLKETLCCVFSSFLSCCCVPRSPDQVYVFS